MAVENGTRQPQEPIMPVISNAYDIFTPEQRIELRELLARLHEEGIEGANAVLDLRIVLD